MKIITGIIIIMALFISFIMSGCHSGQLSNGSSDISSSDRKSVGSDNGSSAADILHNESKSTETNEETSTAEKQSITDTDNTQVQNDMEAFRVSIRFYDVEEGIALPYSLYLTMQEQSFILDFSLPADKSSVEKSITDNILNMWHGEYVKPIKPTISFNWIEETTLVLTVGNLTSNGYCIHLKGSKDATGMFAIGEGYLVDMHGIHFNMLEFEILSNQKIYILDPDTLNYREIPLNSRYYYAFGNLSPSGRTAFIGRITNSFEAVHYMPTFVNLTNGNITDPSDDSMMDISGNWVMDKLLWYNRLLDAETGTNKTVIQELTLSSLMLRNGEYISLATVNNDTDKLIITRYRADGSPIWAKELPDSCRVRIWEGGFFQRPILYELADGSVATTFFDTNNKVYNVYKLNLNSSEDPATLLHKNSFIAAISPDAKRYALYKEPQSNFISSKVEIHSLDGLEKTIIDEELAKNMCLFWQNNSLYVCNSGYPDHVYIHIIDATTGKGRTIIPKVTDNVSGFVGITPEGEVVMIESNYSMALFR